jgi:hypothetical protein
MKNRTRNILLAVSVVGVMLLMATNASAFDGQRKGFILGFGLGPGMDMHKQNASVSAVGASISDTDYVDKSKFAFMTDFKLGYAPTDQLIIYYDNKVSWIKGDFGEVVVVDVSIPKATVMGYADVMVLSGLTGLGVNYFFAPQAPSPFVTGGLGLASAMAFESGATAKIGFGFFVGGGYEFAPHWYVEGDVCYGSATNSESTYHGLVDYDLKQTDLAFKVSINVMAY